MRNDIAHYRSLKGVGPTAVDDAVITAYKQDLEQRSPVAEPTRLAATAPTAPDNRRYYALLSDAYPKTLHRNLAAWRAGPSGENPFRKCDSNPLQLASVATRTRQLREYLAALVHQGVDAQEPVT